jgi:nicotinamidase-related amidase
MYKIKKRGKNIMKNLLLVVDVQNDFVTGSLGSEEAQKILPNISNRVAEYHDKDDFYTLYTQDTHFSWYLETSEGRNLPVEHCLANTWGWKIAAGALPPSGVPKNYMKLTFGDLNLPLAIRNLTNEPFNSTGRDLRILIVGLVTNICVVSNALILKTAFPDAEIVVDAACCAGTSFGEHLAALKVMKSCQITVINAPEAFYND